MRSQMTHCATGQNPVDKTQTQKAEIKGRYGFVIRVNR